MDRIWIVQNRRAGEDPELQVALDRLRRTGSIIEVRPITDAGQGVELAAEAARRGASVIVAAGGDGTLNEVVSGILQAGPDARCAVAVLPYGTGNDFADAAGVPTNDPAAALQLLEQRAELVDVGLCNGRPFVNMATGGFPAELTTEVGETTKSLLGRFAYAVTGALHVLELVTYPARIRIPRERWEGEVYALVVGNGRQAGGGVEACPWAFVNDGLLDLVLLPEAPDESLLDLFVDHRRLRSAEPPEHLRYFKVPWIELEAPEELQVNLDGQPLRETRFRFEVLPRRLPMHLPAGSTLLTRGPRPAATAPPG